MRAAGIFRYVAYSMAAGGLMMAAAGCVTQDWVTNTIRDMNKPLEADVAELRQSANVEKTRVYQLTERMGQVEGRTGQLATQLGETRGVADGAARAANEAKAQAGAAAAKAETVDGRVALHLANRNRRDQVHQAELTFELGRADLSPQDQVMLADVVKMLAQNASYTCDVVGNTDKLGPADYNVDLSWYRHETVRRFLAQKGIELHRVSFLGFGEEMASGSDPAGRAKDRNVVLRVFRPAD